MPGVRAGARVAAEAAVEVKSVSQPKAAAAVVCGVDGEKVLARKEYLRNYMREYMRKRRAR